MSLNALSVDLEEYFQVSNFAGVIDRDAWPELDSRVGDATRRLLDAFDATGPGAQMLPLLASEPDEAATLNLISTGLATPAAIHQMTTTRPH